MNPPPGCNLRRLRLPNYREHERNITQRYSSSGMSRNFLRIPRRLNLGNEFEMGLWTPNVRSRCEACGTHNCTPLTEHISDNSVHRFFMIVRLEEVTAAIHRQL
jgi:hypothetical protein